MRGFPGKFVRSNFTFGDGGDPPDLLRSELCVPNFHYSGWSQPGKRTLWESHCTRMLLGPAPTSKSFSEGGGYGVISRRHFPMFFG